MKDRRVFPPEIPDMGAIREGQPVRVNGRLLYVEDIRDDCTGGMQITLATREYIDGMEPKTFS